MEKTFREKLDFLILQKAAMEVKIDEMVPDMFGIGAHRGMRILSRFLTVDEAWNYLFANSPTGYLKGLRGPFQHWFKLHDEYEALVLSDESVRIEVAFDRTDRAVRAAGGYPEKKDVSRHGG